MRRKWQKELGRHRVIHRFHSDNLFFHMPHRRFTVPFFMTVNNVICAWICFISFEHYRCYAISIIVVDCIAVWRIVYTCIKLVEKERLMFKISSNMLHSVLSRFITVRQVCLLHRDEPTCTRNFKNSANQKHSMKNILNFFFSVITNKYQKKKNQTN